MVTKQTIVVIGTGNRGRSIATRLAGGNFYLLLCDKEFAKSAALATELRELITGCDVEAMQCTFDCAWEADIIILALDFQEQQEVAAYIRDVVNQKILIGLVHANDEITSGIASASCQAAALQVLLPNTKLVNIIYKDSFTDEPVLLTGCHHPSVEIISEMLDSVGIQSIQHEQLPA